MHKMKRKTIDQLLDNAPCGYLQIETNGTILRINKTLRRWLDYESEEDIVTRSIEDLFSMGGKIYCQTHLLPLLQMQGELSEINLTMAGKNASTFPALLNAKKDDHKPGKMPTYSVFVVDITQRKKYESELLLERKNAEEAAEKLKQVNRDLEQFAYTASHDLQSPLRTISAMIHMLEKKKGIESDSESAKLFSLIKSNANQMRLMVRDLLEYSKIDEDRSDYTPVSIEEVCRKAIGLMREDFEKHRVVLNISELPMVPGSELQLIRLFQNLFENSIKYRSEAAPVIAVTHKETNNYHHIQVEDNGIGFEKEYAEDIFSFMKRLHTNHQIPGTGIGLTACKRIMENHGGMISAEPGSEKGAIFKLQFPRR